MVSLDARAYLLEVEAALEEAGMPRRQRKLAVREVRSLLQEMAFDLAARKREPSPRDLHHDLALQAMKPPEATARVLMDRRDTYRDRTRRKRWRTLALLVLVVVAGIAVWSFSTSQASDPVYTWTKGVPNATTASYMDNFTVEEGYERLDLELRVLQVSEGGSFTVWLFDPDHETVLHQEFDHTEGTPYVRRTLPPTAGTWQVVVDLHDVEGSFRLDVRGVRST